ncbi:FAST kinase-like protein, subdomain 1, partial [Haematococcus lacustris]
GLAQLHHRPADGQLLPGLAAWVVDHSSSMNARDVVMVLHSCCSLGQAPPDLVNSLASRAAHIPRTFTPHAIATLLRCLATAPPDTLEGAWPQQLDPARTVAATPLAPPPLRLAPSLRLPQPALNRQLGPRLLLGMRRSLCCCRGHPAPPPSPLARQRSSVQRP